MTNFLPVALTASVAQKCADSEFHKGSITNTVAHAYQQGKNVKKGAAKDVFILTTGATATAAATIGVAKSPTAQNLIRKAGHAIADKFFSPECKGIRSTLANVANKVAPFIQKGLKAFSALPAPAKLVAMAGVALTGLAIKNNDKQTIYNSGKISQEYTDKQKISEAL